MHGALTELRLSLQDIPAGLEELEEVNRNISERIHPAENHIVFETNHGVDKYVQTHSHTTLYKPIHTRPVQTHSHTTLYKPIHTGR